MKAFRDFLVFNRLPVIIGIGALVVALVAFSFLVGLTAAITAPLFLFAVAATVGVYRLRTRHPLSGPIRCSAECF